MPIQIAPPSPQQSVASGTFGAGVAGSVTIPALPGLTAVITGVTLTTGTSGSTIHGIWTVTDGNGQWTQQYYVFMSATIPPAPIDLTWAPGLYATAVNKPITVSVPTISSGAPYAIAVQGYYTGP